METSLRRSGFLFAGVFALGFLFNLIQTRLRGIPLQMALINLTQLFLLAFVGLFLLSTLRPWLRWLQPLVFLAAFPLAIFPTPDRIYGLGFYLTGVLLLERAGFFLRRRALKVGLLLAYLLSAEIGALVLGKGPPQDAAGAAFFTMAFGLFLWFLYRQRLVVVLKEPKPSLSLSELGLSPAERSYVLALIEGRSAKEIGLDFDISESTVRNTLSRAYRKLRVEDGAGFAALVATHEVLP